MILASSRGASRAPQSWADVLPGILLGIGALVATIVLVAIVLTVMRRRVLAAERAASDAGVFEQLRALHARGELSDEEFETARRKLIARLRGEAPSEPAPAPGVRVARAGHDLTGEPLPSPTEPPRPDND